MAWQRNLRDDRGYPTQQPGRAFGDGGGYGERFGHLADPDYPAQRRPDPENVAAQRAQPAPSFRGVGPLGYQRSDERVRERVCDALTDDHHVDASHIKVEVKGGEVTLTGYVADREAKRCAERCVEDLGGVKEVINNLRVKNGRQGSESDVSSS